MSVCAKISGFQFNLQIKQTWYQSGIDLVIKLQEIITLPKMSNYLACNHLVHHTKSEGSIDEFRHHVLVTTLLIYHSEYRSATRHIEHDKK